VWAKPRKEVSHARSEGRILRVKYGYNPNSSSMGSIVFALPASLVGVTAGFGFVSSVITSAFVKDTEKDACGGEATPDKTESAKEGPTEEGQ
jgi:hypothetical protein